MDGARGRATHPPYRSQNGEPSIDAFLGARAELKDRLLADSKWRNRALIAIKNRALPTFLRSATTAELTAFVTRLEQQSLDVAHEEELVKDRAARLVEKNESADENGQGVDELREIAIIYRARIEILKAILGLAREEITNRGR